MKKAKRGAKRIIVTMLAIMLVTESVSVPVKGEVKESAEAQADMISGQTLSESVEAYTEEAVSANFVSPEETEVSENDLKKEEQKKEDEETDAEKTAGSYSGTDGDLEWSIDSDGYLTVSGQGDYEKTPDWLEYKDDIKHAKISVQNITSMKEFFKYCSNLEDVVFIGTDMSQVTDMSGMFYGCSKLNGVDMREFDTSKVTTMKNMFWACKDLKHIWMDGIDTCKVTDMSGLFSYCTSLEKIDVSMLDMSQLTDLSGLFMECSSLEQVSLGNPDTSLVQDMGSMFKGCKLLEEIDVSELETVNVIIMSSMFSECEKLTKLDLSALDLSKVAETNMMFYNCIALETLEFGDTKLEALNNTVKMFYGCEELQEIDLTKFDTTNVYNMEGMFMGCRKVKELDVSHFKTVRVQSFDSMFNGCESVKELDVTGFETGNAIDMSGMFLDCASVKKLDVSGFDMTKVYDMERMFSGCSSLTDFTFGEDKNMEQVLSIYSMFEGCRSLKKLKLDLYLPKVTRMDYFFKDCSSLSSLKDVDIDAFYLKRAKGMYQGCSSLKEEPDGFNSLSVEDISYLFKDCKSLERVTLPARAAYNLKNINYAFEGCSSLRYIEFPMGDADNIESMYNVFSGCSSLKSIDLWGFRTPRVTEISRLFYQCSSLERVQMEVLKNDGITSMYSVFEGCRSLQSISLSGLELKENSITRDNFKECTSLIEIDVTPSMMQCLTTSKYHNFDGCELFSEFHVSGTNSEWTAVRPLWQSCSEKKVKYASVHLFEGPIEQTLQHEGSFRYIKQGGFGTQAQEDYVYDCDLSQFFGSSYNYNHNLGRMSIRVAMAAMSDDTNVNSSNIRALMDDLNLSKKKISYPKPEYNSIGYAMGTRRIYHNNQKKTLIMVAIRGGGYGAEWGGNANVGSGGEHEGFDLAATQVYEALGEYINELRTCGFIGKDDKEIAVWISGYSRGAATANLLAAKLDDQYYLSTMLPEFQTADVKSENVFAFCFECPRNTVNQYHDNSRYQNIFNIINPKDFVTYVAMNNGLDWRFNRYGKDLVLPDEANTKGSDYGAYYASMKAVYQAGIAPEIGGNQSILVKDISKQFADLISKEEYVWWHQEQVQPILVSIMSKQLDLLSFYKEYIKILVNYNHTLLMVAKPQFDILLADIAFVNKGILHAHYPELCMAWMDSISEDVLTKQKSFWNVFVNCPVDIYVYEDKNLVGCIKNDVPQHIENGVITMMDSNGQKQVVLPGDGEYRVVYKATDNGTMTISTSKYIQTETIPESVTAYYELPLKTGDTYEAMVTGGDFALYDSAKTVVNPSVVQNGADVKTYKVDITVEGDGEASGINTYAVGEFAKVFAYPKDGEKFLGWYENGNLISSETEYRFCVKKDTALTAKFTKNTKTSKKDEQSVAVGKLYKVNKHTYKVTSVKKKTVSFVKTSSKSKTIKIPATVTIKGTKYIVASIAANALKGNKKVTKITIGKNVTSIGKKAFYKCTALKTIIIPSKVKTIGESAFSGCKKLTKATIGKGVTKIGKKAFYNCKKLKSVTIKTTKLKSVGKYAFKGIAKQATIKCPAKKVKKYKKILKKSKIAKTVEVK